MRYKQTFLDIAWALVLPALPGHVYVVVFGKFAKFSKQDNTAYPILVLLGSRHDAVLHFRAHRLQTSLVTNLPLVTKVYFPRVLLPFAAVIVARSTS